MVKKIFDLAGRRVFVAGHRGMVGSAILRRLASVDCEVITVVRDKLDLLDGAAASRYLAEVKPDVVIVAAAKVGGIHANNTYPAEFIHENLGIALNTIHGSYNAGVKKLLFLGSSCIYPKLAHQPMTEEELYWLTGADQRVVCHRQDREDQARSSLSPPVWRRLHFGSAEQSLWSGR